MRVWSKFDEQVFQMIGRSRAASSPKDARLTEMSNGVLVSRLALEKEKEPEITILNDSWEREQSKVSVPTNKLKAINDFIKSNGRN